MTEAPLDAERRVVLGLLVQEDGLYERLADLAQQEHDTILGGRPEPLERLLAEKEKLIQRVILLEAERLASIGRLGAGLGRREQLTLSTIKEIWSEDELQQVNELQRRLQLSIQRTADLNRRNASLLRSSLAMLNRWMDLLIGDPQAPTTYNSGGQQRRRRAPVAVNRTA